MCQSLWLEIELYFTKFTKFTTGTSHLGRLKLRCSRGLHHGSCVQTADETPPHLTPDLTTTMAFEDNYQTCEPFVNCTADLIMDNERNISHCQPPAVQNISELMLSSIGKRRTVAVIVTTYFVFLSRSGLHHRSDRQHTDPHDVSLPSHLSRQNTQKLWSGLQHDPGSHGDSDNPPEYL